MKRLLLLALLALFVAGCGKVTEVREPDVFAGEGIKPPRRARSGRWCATASTRPRAR
jgi:hypothetical protein